jgi:hypothetical protein
MAGRRTFRLLTCSQLSGIKVKAVIRPKYNLYIVMIDSFIILFFIYRSYMFQRFILRELSGSASQVT